MRIATLTRALRVKPYDTSTPEGRAQERNRRALLSTLASVGARSISLVSMLLLAPLALDYLGAERYGMWMTISAVTAMLSFADFGIGNGLLNAISASHGRSDTAAARQYVSSAYVMLSSVAVAIGLVFALAYSFVDWARIFNVTSPQAAREAGPSIAVFVACFVLSMPLGVVQRIQQGYQEGFIDSFWVAMGKIAGLIGVVVAIVLKLSLPWLIAAFSGLPVVALALNTGVLFLRRKRWLRPRLGNVSWLFARKLFQIGSLFFVLQLAVTIAFSSDSIVIAQIRGAEAVAEYAVVKQLFMIVSVGVAMILGPLWPAYGEAFARKDLEWAKRTFIRSLAICVLIASGFSLVMALFGKQILLAWVGDEVVPSRLLFWAFGLWTVVQSINNALAMLLNGAQVVRFQVIIAVLMAMTNLVLSVVLCYGVGISGVVWGSLISTTVLVLIPGMLFVIRMFDERWWHNRDVDWLISER